MSYIVIGLGGLLVFVILLFVVGIVSDMSKIKKENNKKYRGY